MPRRVASNKTRYGCAQCKHRRVKCDEHKPVCRNCSKLRRECSFTTTTPFSQILSDVFNHADGKSTSNSMVMDETIVPLQISGFQGLCPAFNLDDMTLLQLFTSKTAVTLSDSSAVQSTWRTAVIRLGFKHRFLLQGILAISALHMANIKPLESKDLCILAASRKDAALHEFRSELDHVTSENFEALFAFSFLIGYYIPASAGTAINPAAHFMKDDFLGSVVEWVRLYLGTGSIVENQQKQMAKGPLTAFLSEWTHLRDASIESDIEQRSLLCVLQLTSLTHRHCPQDRTFSMACNQMRARRTSEEIQANLQALKFLVNVFRFSPEHNSSNLKTPLGENVSENLYNSCGGTSNVKPSGQWLSLSLLWLTQVPTKFVDLIEQRHPVSLIIFAYFAVALYQGPEMWWNSQIPGRIVETIYEALQPANRPWIKWPVGKILGPSALPGFTADNQQHDIILDVLLH